MRIEDELRELIVKKYGSVISFSNATGIKNATLSHVLKTGIGRTSLSNVFKICDALSISADALAKGKIEPKVTERHIKDLEVVVEDMKTVMANNDIYLDGLVLSDMEKEILLVTINVGIETIRGRRK